MPQSWEEVKAWRKRAKDLRKLADSFALPSVKDGLLNSAQSYEQMADDLERKLKQEGAEPPSG